MLKRSLTTKLLATALILSVQSMFVPAIAGPEPAAISGTILASQTHAPLTGAKLLAGDPLTGEIYSSLPTAADGSFVIKDLPPASYELAVQADNGLLYLVDSPVKLAPGQSEDFFVAVNMDRAATPEESQRKKGTGSIWDNQLTAAGIVIASAVILGEIIKQLTDENNPSPSEVSSAE